MILFINDVRFLNFKDKLYLGNGFYFSFYYFKGKWFLKENKVLKCFFDLENVYMSMNSCNKGFDKLF